MGNGMKLQSLGYRTDLIFARFGGAVIERDKYWVILTESNPRYYWGNYILFKDSPKADDLGAWKALFDREVKTRVSVGHYAFGWDATGEEAGDLGQFVDEGFHVNRSIVLAATSLVPPARANTDIEIRELAEDWEWEEACRIQIETREACHDLESYTDFTVRKMASYREMVKAGLGTWFGAFLGRQMAANLGIFRTGELARFQNVVTSEAHRNKGICGSLVYAASRHALARMDVDRLVMVADEEYHAAKIYEKLGFAPVEHQYGMEWWKR